MGPFPPLRFWCWLDERKKRKRLDAAKLEAQQRVIRDAMRAMEASPHSEAELFVRTWWQSEWLRDYTGGDKPRVRVKAGRAAA